MDRAQELCESRGERPGYRLQSLIIHNYGLCGRKAKSEEEEERDLEALTPQVVLAAGSLPRLSFAASATRYSFVAAKLVLSQQNCFPCSKLQKKKKKKKAAELRYTCLQLGPPLILCGVAELLNSCFALGALFFPLFFPAACTDCVHDNLCSCHGGVVT